MKNRNPATAKPKLKGLSPLGQIGLLSWSLVTVLLVQMAMADGYPMEKFPSNSYNSVLVWYWLSATAIALVFHAVAHRSALRQWWNERSKPFLLFGVLGAAFSGAFAATLVFSMAHLQHQKSSLVSLFDSYQRTNALTPSLKTEKGEPNPEWADATGVLREDRQAEWCQRATLVHDTFVAVTTTPQQTNQAMAAVLAGTQLNQLQAQGCLSDDAWIAGLNRFHHLTKTQPGPDVFTQKSVPWNPIFRLLGQTDVHLVKLTFPSEQKICSSITRKGLPFKDQGAFCEATFSSDKAVSAADVERIRRALEERMTATVATGAAP